MRQITDDQYRDLAGKYGIDYVARKGFYSRSHPARKNYRPMLYKTQPAKTRTKPCNIAWISDAKGVKTVYDDRPRKRQHDGRRVIEVSSEEFRALQKRLGVKETFKQGYVVGWYTKADIKKLAHKDIIEIKRRVYAKNKKR